MSKFLYMLTVLFAGLKLTGHIDWSWIIVSAPALIAAIPWILVLSLSLIFCFWIFFDNIYRKLKNRQKNK